MPDVPLLKPAKLFHVEQSAFDPIPTIFPVPAETKLFHVEQSKQDSSLGAPGPDSRTWDTANTGYTFAETGQIVPRGTIQTRLITGCPRSGFSDLGDRKCRIHLC
jgi:hypothetical protein